MVWDLFLATDLGGPTTISSAAFYGALPKSVIDNFIRISPVAWEHLSFTGRYNFTKDNSIMDLEKIVRFLEEKLGKNTKH